ncbi:MAG: flippase [Clostridia bacterium]|nr:flippase [Clostridia bacterium]
MKEKTPKEPKIRSVQFNFIMNAILTISSIIFPMITFPYASRVLSVAGYGKVSFATSVLTYFAMFASLGIPNYGIRACARVRDDKVKLSRTAQELIIINLVTSAITYAAFFASLFFVERFEQDKTLLIINSVSIILNTLGVTWLYSALEQYSYITVRNILCKLLSIILMFIFVHNPSDYIVYGAIAMVASGGSNLLNFLNIRKLIIVKPLGDYHFKQHLKPIFVFFATSVAISVYTNLDTVMLGFMTDDVQTGLYSASVKVKNLLCSVVSSLGAVLLPRLSLYVRNEETDKFFETLSKVLNFLLLISLPLTVYFLFFARTSILLFSGAEYEPATPAMQLLMPTVFFIALSGLTGNQILVPLGREKAVMVSVICGAVIDFGLNWIFIPKWGAAGAAAATMIAELVVLAVQLCFLQKTALRVARGVKYRPILISLLGATVTGWLCLRFLPISSHFWMLAVSAVLFFGVYGALLLLQKESFLTENIQLAVGFVKGKLKK